jgi:hypothetical protein
MCAWQRDGADGFLALQQYRDNSRSLVKETIMRRLLALFAVGLALVASPAAADWTGKNAAGTTITFFNGVDCTSGTCIPVAALVNAAGATAYGTAGSANAAVLTVQGIASGTPQPVSGTVAATQSGTWTVQPGNTANTTPWLATIAQGGNSAIVKAGNTFAASDVALGVAVTNTLASVTPGDGITTTVYGTAPASPVIGVPLLWNGTTYDRQKSSGSTGIAAAGLFQGATALSATNGIFANILQGNAVLSATNPSFARSTDGTRSAIVDPCEANLQSSLPILMTTATTLQVVAASASNKTYICSLFLKASAVNNVALVEGTGGSCVTGIAGVIGGTTTANGFVFGTAGDGVLLQSGGKVAVAQTAGTNVGLCLITSTTGPLIGTLKYVQAP